MYLQISRREEEKKRGGEKRRGKKRSEVTHNHQDSSNSECSTHPSWSLLVRELRGQGAAPSSSTLQLPKGAGGEQNRINESDGVRPQLRKKRN